MNATRKSLTVLVGGQPLLATRLGSWEVFFSKHPGLDRPFIRAWISEGLLRSVSVSTVAACQIDGSGGAGFGESFQVGFLRFNCGADVSRDQLRLMFARLMWDIDPTFELSSPSASVAGRKVA